MRRVVPPASPAVSRWPTSCTTHSFFFFFNDTATTEIYTHSLHDALPICQTGMQMDEGRSEREPCTREPGDRKSTRLNSSHGSTSYAVFCLKKKTQIAKPDTIFGAAGPPRRAIHWTLH